MSDLEKLLRDEAEHAETHQDAPAGPRTTATRPGHARSTVYSVRLNPDEVAALQEYAETAGLPASTLVRSWIIERIRANGATPDLRKIIHDEVQAAVRDALRESA
ncbi:DUF6290 family protein [Pseudonocardia parietis]|uniref:Ribbon-helix-helix CopG family protein n=1 Tax=Pseudonocardia parietis TaxID=570936 RepID=A0ABS4VWY7_9PSEU|nr:DUF6290 family protein [Pseudonocardia parietis]MBP2368418.1 hypothetical protein [Pseudonocardia parietis]